MTRTSTSSHHGVRRRSGRIFGNFAKQTVQAAVEVLSDSDVEMQETAPPPVKKRRSFSKAEPVAAKPNQAVTERKSSVSKFLKPTKSTGGSVNGVAGKVAGVVEKLNAKIVASNTSFAEQNKNETSTKSQDVKNTTNGKNTFFSYNHTSNKENNPPPNINILTTQPSTQQQNLNFPPRPQPANPVSSPIDPARVLRPLLPQGTPSALSPKHKEKNGNTPMTACNALSRMSVDVDDCASTCAGSGNQSMYSSMDSATSGNLKIALNNLNQVLVSKGMIFFQVDFCFCYIKCSTKTNSNSTKNKATTPVVHLP